MTSEQKPELTRRQVREVREVMLDLADHAEARGYDNLISIYPDTILRLVQALGIEPSQATKSALEYPLAHLTVETNLFLEKPSTRTKVLVEKARGIVGMFSVFSEEAERIRSEVQ